MSLRERLRNRQLPATTVSIRVEFGSESDTAESDLVTATRALNLAAFRNPDGEHAELRQRVDAAQVATDAFYETLRVRALSPGDMEALIAAHPPTAAQRQADPTVAWNRTTFRPALIAVCVDGEETDEDWADLLTSGPITDGEVAMLFGAAITVNDRSADLRVGKDSAGNRSSP